MPGPPVRLLFLHDTTVTEPKVQTFRMPDLVLFQYFRDFQVLMEESGLKESLVHRFPFYILIPWFLLTAHFPVDMKRRGWEQGVAVCLFLQGFMSEQFFNIYFNIRWLVTIFCKFCFLNCNALVMIVRRFVRICRLPCKDFRL